MGGDALSVVWLSLLLLRVTRSVSVDTSEEKLSTSAETDHREYNNTVKRNVLKVAVPSLDAVSKEFKSPSPCVECTKLSLSFKFCVVLL